MFPFVFLFKFISNYQEYYTFPNCDWSMSVQASLFTSLRMLHWLELHLCAYWFELHLTKRAPLHFYAFELHLYSLHFLVALKFRCFALSLFFFLYLVLFCFIVFYFSL